MIAVLVMIALLGTAHTLVPSRSPYRPPLMVAIIVLMAALAVGSLA